MLNIQLDESLPDQQIKTTSRLSADIHIVLHTRIAQSLFNGSWKLGKMGLLQFARVVSALWDAARKDDPYAEWYLLKTYQALFDARKQIKAMEEVLATYFNTIRGVEVNTVISSNPINHPLTFATPFGFMGAYLLADVDYVLRQLLTLERIGIPVDSESTSIKQVIKHIQAAFSEPRHWRRTGITRQDIEENNEKAKNVTEKFGKVPDSVLHKKIAFAFLPKKQKGSVHEQNSK